MGKLNVARHVNLEGVRYDAQRVQALADLLDDITCEMVQLRSPQQTEHVRYALTFMLTTEMAALVRDLQELEKGVGRAEGAVA